MAFSGKAIDYTENHLSRAVILLAIPMVLEMSMESLFAVCDIFFVGQLGESAVTAVGLTESCLSILYAIAMGLSMSTIAVVSRRIGEKKPDDAILSAQQAINLGFGVSFVFAVFAGFFAPDILRLMGADEATLSEGTTYARILFASNGVIFLLFLNNAIFRGAGDPAFSMRTLILANSLNIILDPILIFGLGPIPGFGLMGAAMATTIGRGTGVIYQLYHLRRGSSRINLGGSRWCLDFKVLADLARISVGGIGQILVQTTSWVASVRILSTFGAPAVAGFTIAIRVILFAILPAFGLSNAAATLVGQNLGAGKPERAERTVWITGTLAMVFLGAVSITFILSANRLVRFFADDPQTIEYGTQALTIISYGFIFYAWGMTSMQAFNGAGDTKTPTWVNLACFWFFQIPLALILSGPMGLGAKGVFWAMAGSYSLSAMTGLFLFRSGRWKSHPA